MSKFRKIKNRQGQQQSSEECPKQVERKESPFVYYAFISYKHADRAPWAKSIAAWAKKIYLYLEAWEIPTALSEELKIHEKDERVKPIFLDNAQMYAGEEVNKILERNLVLSKSLVVILTRQLIQDQRDLRMRGEQAYIFHEIDCMLAWKRPIILVWVDNVPFDKDSAVCMPDALKGSDLMVIDVNAYRKKEGFHLKRKVAALVAASIFQTRVDVFWNWYERKQKQLYQRIALGLLAILIGVAWLWNQRQINLGYKLAGEARMELEKGNRQEAARLAVRAYQAYSGVDGLPLLMQQCLDEGRSIKSFDKEIVVNEQQNRYAAIQGGRWVEVYSLDTDSLLARFDGFQVSRVALSPDGKRVAGFSPRFLRVFDVEKAAAEPLMELTDSFEEFETVDFNASGTLLLTQRTNCHAWAVYAIEDGRRLYQEMGYPHLDTWRWYEERASFGGTDSTLFIYGKTSGKEPEVFHPCRAPEGAEWKCCLYDLRKRDAQRSQLPVLIKELEIPEGTQRIVMPRNYATVLMMGPEQVRWVRWFPKGERFSIWTKSFGGKIYGYSEDALAVYKAEHPDTWNRVEVTQVLFSSNEQYVALVDRSNVVFVLPTDGSGRVERWNGLNLTMSADSENVKHRVIGVTDDGYPIFYAPATSQGGWNVYVKRRNNLNTSEYTLFSLPLDEGFAEMRGWQTKGGLFYLSACRETEPLSWTDVSALSVRTFLCQREQKGLVERYANRFAQQTDSVVETLSGHRKYGVVSVMREYGLRNRYLLWNWQEHKPVALLNDALKPDESFSRAVCFVPGTDDLLLADYWTPRDEKGNCHSAQLLMDVEKGKVLLRGNRVQIVGGDEPVVFATREDSLVTYDVRHRQVKGAFPGKLWPKSKCEGERLVLLEEELSQRIVSRSLYDGTSHRLIMLPDSLHNRVTAVSRDGRWLLVRTDYAEETLAVLDAASWETLTVLPERIAGKFAVFTPDSRFVLYRGQRQRGLCLWDIERKQLVYALGGAVEICENGSMSYVSLWNSSRFDGFALSSQRLAVASYGLTVVEWHTGKVLKVFQLDLPPSPKMVFSPNGRYLLVENYLLDMEQMVCLYEALPSHPIELTDEGVRYQDAFYRFASAKQLFQLLVASERPASFSLPQDGKFQGETFDEQ